jgi:hypothetical protein
MAKFIFKICPLKRDRERERESMDSASMLMTHSTTALHACATNEKV